jgi:N utilization substance protein B
MSASSRSPRSRARRAALQALYQWQMTAEAPDTIAGQFRDEKSSKRMDEAYFLGLLHGVPCNVEDLDARLAPFLDRPVAQVDAVERAILRMGAFELAQRKEVPWRVVINECVELAREFGAEQSHRYVNAILDKLARVIRDEARRVG